MPEVNDHHFFAPRSGLPDYCEVCGRVREHPLHLKRAILKAKAIKGDLFLAINNSLHEWARRNPEMRAEVRGHPSHILQISVKQDGQPVQFFEVKIKETYS